MANISEVILAWIIFLMNMKTRGPIAGLLYYLCIETRSVLAARWINGWRMYGRGSKSKSVFSSSRKI